MWVCNRCATGALRDGFPAIETRQTSRTTYAIRLYVCIGTLALRGATRSTPLQPYIATIAMLGLCASFFYHSCLIPC